MQEFADALDSGLYLWIVIEYQGEIVAVGGICLDKQMDSTSHLTFGMVHPDWHGKGFGTALLFARLAALPRPDGWARIFMSSVDSSVGFYRRFGFTFFGRLPLDDTPNEFDIYYTVLDRRAWQMLHTLLDAAALEIDLERIAIPPGP